MRIIITSPRRGTYGRSRGFFLSTCILRPPFFSIFQDDRNEKGAFITDPVSDGTSIPMIGAVLASKTKGIFQGGTPLKSIPAKKL